MDQSLSKESPRHQGDDCSLHAFTQKLYQELRAQARKIFICQPHHQTLQPTVLVHETFLRMGRSGELEWNDRSHFLALASKMMHQILIEYARNQRAQKRGRDWRRITLSDVPTTNGSSEIDSLMLVELLEELESLNDRHCRVVEMRVFAGMSFEEIARALDVSNRTVERDWRAARAWLASRMEHMVSHDA